jgi:hypothetical protein
MQGMNGNTLRCGSGCFSQLFAPGIVAFVSNANRIHGTQDDWRFIREQDHSAGIKRRHDFPRGSICDGLAQLWSDILIERNDLQIAGEQRSHAKRNDQDE